MESNIIDYISQFIKLTVDEVRIIGEQNLFRHYKKNDIMLSEGEYAKDCYFIVQGCVRLYYIKDGEERNTDFFFENQTIRPGSYQTKLPSEYYLSCLEDCLLAIGNETKNQKISGANPKIILTDITDE